MPLVAVSVCLSVSYYAFFYFILWPYIMGAGFERPR